MWQIIGITLGSIFLLGLILFIRWAFLDWMSARHENADLTKKNAEMNKQGYAMTMNLEALRGKAMAEGHLEGVRRFFEEHATASAEARYLPKIEEQNSLLLLQARNAEEEAGRAQRLRGQAADAAERQKAEADSALRKAWELQKQVKLLKAEKEAKVEIEQTFKDRQTPIRSLMKPVHGPSHNRHKTVIHPSQDRHATVTKPSHDRHKRSGDGSEAEIIPISIPTQSRSQNIYAYSPYYLDRRGETNTIEVYDREFDNPKPKGI